MKRLARIVVVATLGVLVGVNLPKPASAQPTTTTTEPAVEYALPASIDATCTTNVTAALQDYLNSLPQGATVSLGNAQSCYKSNGVLAIRDKSIHIEGHGATINAPKAGTVAEAGTSPHPIILFAKDIDTSMTDVNINGAFDGSTNGGVKYEHFIGIETVSSKNLTLDGVNVANIQGDCVSIQFPVTSNPINVSGTALNRNVTIENSSFKKCGWVNFSIESVNGLRVTNTTIGKSVDSIDMEYNIYSSFIPANAENGQARFAAMDNILFDHDKFNNWQAVWFVTKNGQTKCQPHPTKPCAEGGGVQQRNVALEDNTLNGSGGLVDVLGTNPDWTTEPYINQGLTITNNTNSQTARPLFGGAITKPHAGQAMQLQYVTDVNISGNNFPLFHGTATYYPNTLYMDAVKPKSVTGLQLSHNNFHGGLSVVYGGKYNQNVVKCENGYGLHGENDGQCLVAVQLPA